MSLGKERLMKTNMGAVDRLIRIAAAAAIVVLYCLEVINGVWAVVLGIVAVVFIVTSFIGFCPLYVPFRISTKKRPKPSS